QMFCPSTGESRPINSMIRKSQVSPSGIDNPRASLSNKPGQVIRISTFPMIFKSDFKGSIVADMERQEETDPVRAKCNLCGKLAYSFCVSPND
ncbi:hypothetical protein PMAYCL1PPCAC_05013, partial [Pristionchus mayeri]